VTLTQSDVSELLEAIEAGGDIDVVEKRGRAGSLRP